jgi:hypothetical protein
MSVVHALLIRPFGDVLPALLQMTIAQIVYDNELHFGLSDADIHNKVIPFIMRFFS